MMTETRGDDLSPAPTDTLRAAALRLRVDVFEERREVERGRRSELRDRLAAADPDGWALVGQLADRAQGRRWAIDLALAAWLERWVTLALLVDPRARWGEPDLTHALTVARAVLGQGDHDR